MQSIKTKQKSRSQFISYYLIHILTFVVGYFGTEINIEEYVKKKTLKFQIFPIKKKKCSTDEKKEQTEARNGMENRGWFGGRPFQIWRGALAADVRATATTNRRTLPSLLRTRNT